MKAVPSVFDAQALRVRHAFAEARLSESTGLVIGAHALENDQRRHADNVRVAAGPFPTRRWTCCGEIARWGCTQRSARRARPRSPRPARRQRRVDTCSISTPPTGANLSRAAAMLAATGYFEVGDMATSRRARSPGKSPPRSGPGCRSATGAPTTFVHCPIVPRGQTPWYFDHGVEPCQCLTLG